MIVVMVFSPYQLIQALSYFVESKLNSIDQLVIGSRENTNDGRSVEIALNFFEKNGFCIKNKIFFDISAKFIGRINNAFFLRRAIGHSVIQCFICGDPSLLSSGVLISLRIKKICFVDDGLGDLLRKRGGNSFSWAPLTWINKILLTMLGGKSSYYSSFASAEFETSNTVIRPSSFVDLFHWISLSSDSAMRGIEFGWIVGQPLVELGLIARGKWMSDLKGFIASHNIGKWIYKPHRIESNSLNMDFMPAVSVEVDRTSNLPLEIQAFLLGSFVPDVVVGYYSTALLTLSEILPPKTRIYAIRLDVSGISTQHSASISLAYNHLEKSKRIKFIGKL